MQIKTPTHLLNTNCCVFCYKMQPRPVRWSSGQDLPPLLRICHTVHRLLRVLALTNSWYLQQQQQKPSISRTSKHFDFVPLQRMWMVCFTCTVWTCGDWMTEGWAAWITPCTWTVWPLGNCTRVTVGLLDETWAAAMDACKPNNHARSL